MTPHCWWKSWTILVCPCERVHRRTSLSSFLRLKHVLFILVSEKRDKRLYSCYFVSFCFQYLFQTAHGILVQFPFILFSKHFIKVQVVQPYNSTDTAIAWKNSRFISSDWSDFHMVDNLSMAVHAFPKLMLTLLLVDKILLLRYVK